MYTTKALQTLDQTLEALDNLHGLTLRAASQISTEAQATWSEVKAFYTSDRAIRVYLGAAITLATLALAIAYGVSAAVRLTKNLYFLAESSILLLADVTSPVYMVTEDLAEEPEVEVDPQPTREQLVALVEAAEEIGSYHVTRIFTEAFVDTFEAIEPEESHTVSWSQLEAAFKMLADLPPKDDQAAA